MVVLERYASSAEARNDDARVAEVEAAPGDPRLWTTPTPPALAGAEDALDAAANNTTEPFSDDEDAMRFFVYRRCEFLAARIERESRAGLDSARASSRHHHHHQHQHHHGASTARKALEKRAAALFRAVALALWEPGGDRAGVPGRRRRRPAGRRSQGRPSSDEGGARQESHRGRARVGVSRCARDDRSHPRGFVVEGEK